ncbi:MAG: hypothetical protein WDM79_02490 [Terricaulis sp.]
MQLETQIERDYYAGQASGTIGIINFIGWPLSIIMGIGALAGALKHDVFLRVGAVGRNRHAPHHRLFRLRGLLRHARGSARALRDWRAGAGVVCFIFFNGMTASTLGQSFTQVVFQLKITPELMVQAILMALGIGLVGGVFPGIRAARQSPQIELASQ